MKQPADSSAEAAPAVQFRPKGESWVWVTSMGLALGLAMIVGLLGLIFYNGLEVFWPKRVALVQLVEGSEAGIKGRSTFAGEIVKTQERMIRRLGAAEEEPTVEYQFFVGNKELYGFSFMYVDAHEIASMAWPEDVVVAERVEYGRAIFRPLELRLEGGAVVEAGSGELLPRLRELIDEAAERRDRIKAIERGQIGALNHELEDIRLERRSLEQVEPPPPDAQARLDALEERRAALQAEYEELAARARELRELQLKDTLVYASLDGERQTLPAGDLIDVYQPNTYGFPDKVGHFFHAFWKFLSEEPREANTEGGIFPAIFGTFVMTLIMSAAVTPFGVVAAIYLREYAKQGPLVRGVRIAVNNLAGVPSIVFGVFGLGFFIYFVGGTIDQLFYEAALPTPTFGTGGILWASLTLALMTVPVVIVATEEALAAVSRGIREGSLACGASKWQTIQRIVLPASLPGILTGLILAMARGAGEVAPLMLVGVVKLAPALPIDGVYPYIHLERKFMHLGFHIYDLGFQSPDSEAAKPMVFATTFLLILLVVCLNLSAILVRNHLRRKYKTSTF